MECFFFLSLALVALANLRPIATLSGNEDSLLSFYTKPGAKLPSIVLDDKIYNPASNSSSYGHPYHCPGLTVTIEAPCRNCVTAFSIQCTSSCYLIGLDVETHKHAYNVSLGESVKKVPKMKPSNDGSFIAIVLYRGEKSDHVISIRDGKTGAEISHFYVDRCSSYCDVTLLSFMQDKYLAILGQYSTEYWATIYDFNGKAFFNSGVDGFQWANSNYFVEFENSDHNYYVDAQSTNTSHPIARPKQYVVEAEIFNDHFLFLAVYPGPKNVKSFQTYNLLTKTYGPLSTPPQSSQAWVRGISKPYGCYYGGVMTITAWNAQTEKSLPLMEGNKNYRSACQFNVPERLVAVLNDNNQVNIFKLPTDF